MPWDDPYVGVKCAITELCPTGCLKTLTMSAESTLTAYQGTAVSHSSSYVYISPWWTKGACHSTMVGWIWRLTMSSQKPPNLALYAAVFQNLLFIHLDRFRAKKYHIYQIIHLKWQSYVGMGCGVGRAFQESHLCIGGISATSWWHVYESLSCETCRATWAIYSYEPMIDIMVDRKQTWHERYNGMGRLGDNFKHDGRTEFFVSHGVDANFDYVTFLKRNRFNQTQYLTP